MANGQEVAGLERSRKAREVGAFLSELTVKRRRKEYVGGAQNGDPKPCTDRRAAHVRGEMQREGGSPHWEGIIALDLCDLDDGVPQALVEAPHLYALQVVREHARPARIDRPLSALAIAETKAQARLDLAQLRLAEQPNDPMAIQDALDAADHYAKPFDEYRATLRHRLTVVRAAGVVISRPAGRIAIAGNGRTHVTKSATITVGGHS